MEFLTGYHGLPDHDAMNLTFLDDNALDAVSTVPAGARCRRAVDNMVRLGHRKRSPDMSGMAAGGTPCLGAEAFRPRSERTVSERGLGAVAAVHVESRFEIGDLSRQGGASGGEQFVILKLQFLWATTYKNFVVEFLLFLAVCGTLSR